MKNILYLFLLISQVFFAQSSFEKGNALYQKGQYQQAVDVYESIIKEDKQEERTKQIQLSWQRQV